MILVGATALPGPQSEQLGSVAPDVPQEAGSNLPVPVRSDLILEPAVTRKVQQEFSLELGLVKPAQAVSAEEQPSGRSRPSDAPEVVPGIAALAGELLVSGANLPKSVALANRSLVDVAAMSPRTGYAEPAPKPRNVAAGGLPEITTVAITKGALGFEPAKPGLPAPANLNMNDRASNQRQITKPDPKNHSPLAPRIKPGAAVASPKMSALPKGGAEKPFTAQMNAEPPQIAHVDRRDTNNTPVVRLDPQRNIPRAIPVDGGPEQAAARDPIIGSQRETRVVTHVFAKPIDGAFGSTRSVSLPSEAGLQNVSKSAQGAGPPLPRHYGLAFEPPVVMRQLRQTPPDMSSDNGPRSVPIMASAPAPEPEVALLHARVSVAPAAKSMPSTSAGVPASAESTVDMVRPDGEVRPIPVSKVSHQVPPMQAQPAQEPKILGPERASTAPAKAGPERLSIVASISANPTPLSPQFHPKSAPIEPLSEVQAPFADAPIPVGAASEERAPGLASAAISGPRVMPQPAIVIQQIANVMQELSRGPVEVSLSPEELGRVKLSLQGGDSTMAVMVMAERPETLDLLRRNIDLLAAELQDLGFDDLSFAFGNSDGYADEFEAAVPVTSDEPNMRHHVPHPLIARNWAAGSGLDIRI